MSSNKMLIDATHPEETRVVVLRGGRVEEFDFESAARKLLRGNIYLAKVTRVEPSLQAAFVEYGGNRHGFLAFNEIHPDYYQIPIADRQALLEEEAAVEAAEEAAADAAADRAAERAARRSEPRGEEYAHTANGETSGRQDQPSDGGPAEDGSNVLEVGHLLPPETIEPVEGSRNLASAEPGDDVRRSEPVEPVASDRDQPASADAQNDVPPPSDTHGIPAEVSTADVVDVPSDIEAEQVEVVGTAEDAIEEVPVRPRRRVRSYKIQEVIKRRQVILVQVVKEERGTKGAALTTYLSLAGRYTVLMPNTARGGGISRKITNPADRKRLKAIADELEVPEGMGLIIRTAGASRTKQEIKRDFEYLLRLWESVRDLTLQSTAPCLVYEEGNLIKRSIRDLYTKDVDEIIVAGTEAHAEARDFMGMLMPSHAKNVTLYTGAEPIFTRYQIERQLNAMFSPYVYLRSGGYLVINQTEALVAIDVNSGKSTREFSIEETALNTNIEAAEEIARQLKLRDLAGLIVIDFIDMEERRNNRKVENRLKEALRFDRARIQVGRISHFGLLEMSRQRMRTGVLEGSTSQCPHCQGTGIIRSTESVALAVIRGLEDALMGGRPTSLVATTTSSVALYILNNKRSFITAMEERHGISITVQASEKMHGANFTIERGAQPAQQARRPERAAVNMNWGFDGEEIEDGVEPGSDGDVGGDDPRPARSGYVGDDGEGAEASEGDLRYGRERDQDGGGEGQSRRRRRRRGRRGGDRHERFAREREAHGHEEQPPFEPFDRDPEAAGAGALSGSANFNDVGDANGFVPDSNADVDMDGHRQAPEGGEGRHERRGRRRGRRGGRRGRGEGRFGGGPAEASDNGTYDVASDGPPRRPRVIDDIAEGAQQSAPRDEEPALAPARPANLADLPSSETMRADTQAPPIAIASPAPAGEPAAPPPRRRGEPVSSEPVLERLVVGAETTAPTPVAAEAKPRRGWWQRKVLGE